MAHAPWLTHDLEVVAVDDERQTDAGDSPGPGGWLDEEISESFPASDPLSHWAGASRPTSEADRAHPTPR
jgi:hypothetical protein